MRRLRPLFLMAVFVLLLALGIFLKVLDANRCVDQGGLVVAPMTRSQNCAGQ